MIARTTAAVLIACLTALPAAAADDEGGEQPTKPLWQHELKVPRPWPPYKPAVAHLWLPEGVERVRGLIVADHIDLGAKVARDAKVREAAKDKKLGVLLFSPGLDAMFQYTKRDCDKQLLWTLEQLARRSGHPELERVPWLAVGHSTGGIYARNVAYWKPHRVIGIVHLKSGNFQDGIPDKTRSLTGVPLLAINGEFERYGPKGGDLGLGLRSRYSLHPENKKKRNQTQWVMVRMQLLDRRRKDEDNLMGLVVERGGGHNSWREGMSEIAAQFVRSAADARIPDDPPAGKVVRCKPLTAEDGWLMDPDLKAPEHKPAPYGKYEGDKTLALWYVDEPMAKAVWKYHNKGEWQDPDPTAGEPVEQRYYPPPILQDPIDVPRSQPADEEEDG